MGFWSSVGSAISSGFNAVCSAVSNTVSAIGSSISSFATTVAPMLGGILNTLGNLHPAVKALVGFAAVFLVALGILHPEERVENIGERALQAAEEGITIDKFENFEAYMEALRKFDLKPELTKKYSPTEKFIAGLGVATIGIEDKFKAERGSLNGLWLLPMTNPGYFTPERMQTLLNAGQLPTNAWQYLENRLSAGQARSFEKSLEIPPENGRPMNDTDLGKLYGALDSARTEWATLAQRIAAQNSTTQP